MDDPNVGNGDWVGPPYGNEMYPGPGQFTILRPEDQHSLQNSPYQNQPNGFNTYPQGDAYSQGNAYAQEGAYYGSATSLEGQQPHAYHQHNPLLHPSALPQTSPQFHQESYEQEYGQNVQFDVGSSGHDFSPAHPSLLPGQPAGHDVAHAPNQGAFGFNPHGAQVDPQWQATQYPQSANGYILPQTSSYVTPDQQSGFPDQTGLAGGQFANRSFAQGLPAHSATQEQMPGMQLQSHFESVANAAPVQLATPSQMPGPSHRGVPKKIEAKPMPLPKTARGGQVAANQANVANQANAANQANVANQANAANQAIAANQANATNQVNAANQANAVNSANAVNQANASSHLANTAPKVVAQSTPVASHRPAGPQQTSAGPARRQSTDTPRSGSAINANPTATLRVATDFLNEGRRQMAAAGQAPWAGAPHLVLGQEVEIPEAGNMVRLQQLKPKLKLDRCLFPGGPIPAELAIQLKEKLDGISVWLGEDEKFWDLRVKESYGLVGRDPPADKTMKKPDGGSKEVKNITKDQAVAKSVEYLRLDKLLKNNKTVISAAAESFASFFKQLRALLKSSRDALDDAAKEKADEGELERLRGDLREKRAFIEAVSQAAAQEGDEAVLKELGENGGASSVGGLVLILLINDVMKRSAALETDINGTYPKAILQLLSRIAPKTKLLEERKFSTVQSRYNKEGDDQSRKLIERVLQNATEEDSETEKKAGETRLGTVNKTKATKGAVANATRGPPSSSSSPLKRPPQETISDSSRPVKKIATAAGSSTSFAHLAPSSASSSQKLSLQDNLAAPRVVEKSLTSAEPPPKSKVSISGLSASASTSAGQSAKSGTSSALVATSAAPSDKSTSISSSASTSSKAVTISSQSIKNNLQPGQTRAASKPDPSKTAHAKTSSRLDSTTKTTPPTDEMGKTPAAKSKAQEPAKSGISSSDNKVKKPEPKPASKIGSSQPVPAPSKLAAIIAQINEPRKATQAVMAPEPPTVPLNETPEEKARRLRKEERRALKLRVSWKGGDELRQIRTFTKDENEDGVMGDGTIGNARDNRSEGLAHKRAFKQQNLVDDDDEEEDIPSRPWFAPTLTDLSRLPKERLESIYTSKGGKKTFHTEQQKVMEQREMRELMVVYREPEDIPPTPKSPPRDTTMLVAAPGEVVYPPDTPQFKEFRHRVEDVEKYGVVLALQNAKNRKQIRDTLANLMAFNTAHQAANTQAIPATLPPPPAPQRATQPVAQQPLQPATATQNASLDWYNPALAGKRDAAVFALLNSDKVKNYKDPGPQVAPQMSRIRNHPNPEVQHASDVIESVVEKLRGKPFPPTEPPEWMRNDPTRVKEWWDGYNRERERKAQEMASRQAQGTNAGIPAALPQYGVAYQMQPTAPPPMLVPALAPNPPNVVLDPQVMEALAQVRALQEAQKAQAAHQIGAPYIPPPTSPGFNPQPTAAPAQPNPYQILMDLAASQSQATTSNASAPSNAYGANNAYTGNAYVGNAYGSNGYGYTTQAQGSLSYGSYDTGARGGSDQKQSRDYKSYESRSSSGYGQGQSREQTSGSSGTHQYGGGRRDHEGGGRSDRGDRGYGGSNRGGSGSSQDVPAHLRGINRSLIGTKVCSFWKEGNCKKGEQCTYRHE